jgi:hypothetical protein
MAAVSTSRRKPAGGDLEEQLAGLRAENAELREALRGVAALAIAVGVSTLRASVMSRGPRDVPDVCRGHGVSDAYAAAIDKLFR